MYNGKPENNVKWVKVSEIFGECWNNKTIREIFKDDIMRPYEFVRGDIPTDHQHNEKPKDDEPADTCKHVWRNMSSNEAYPASSGKVCTVCDQYKLVWF